MRPPNKWMKLTSVPASAPHSRPIGRRRVLALRRAPDARIIRDVDMADSTDGDTGAITGWTTMGTQDAVRTNGSTDQEVRSLLRDFFSAVERHDPCWVPQLIHRWRKPDGA